MSVEVCKDCVDRTVGCHGGCQKYLDAVSENKRQSELRKKHISGEKDADAYNANRSMKLKKRYKRRAK